MHPQTSQQAREMLRRHGLDCEACASPVLIFSKSYCPHCTKVKRLFNSLGVRASAVELDLTSEGGAMQRELEGISNQRTVPNVFIGGRHIGGCDHTLALHEEGRLAEALSQCNEEETSAKL